ncbi:MAG: response regulator [Anaerocolumna sp.]
MLKVIIADDEMKVCQLIYHLVDWKDMGLEVAAIVNDGKKAYEEICEKKPDIVITDIRMPNYDGIELIRRTKEILPNVYFIIVSGYSQFEFAQNAIKYGVEDYLLKPLKKKELQHTLIKIIEKYNLLMYVFSEKEELKRMLHTSGEKAKKNLLAEILIDPDCKVLNLGKETLNKEFYCHFEDSFYTILKIRPFIKTGEENKKIYSLLLSKIQHMVNEKLEVCCKEIINTIWDDQIVCLINTDDSTLTAIKKQLNKMKIDILNLKEIFENVNVIVGIGKIVNNLAELANSIQQAEISIMNRFGESGQYIIEYKDSFISDRTVEIIINSNKRDIILSYFELLDIDGILEEISELDRKLDNYSNDGQLIYNCYNEMVNIILFGAKKYMLYNGIQDNEWFQKKYKTFLTRQEIFVWLKHQLKENFEKYTDNKKFMDSKPIRQAKQYINENYNKEIKLENVSNLIGFNPAYFSSLFKKETGENFMEYVMKIRIQNAKDFLLQTNKDVADIAAEVGYTDLKYFSKLFKKKTGLNPTEFRKLYG